MWLIFQNYFRNIFLFWLSRTASSINLFFELFLLNNILNFCFGLIKNQNFIFFFDIWFNDFLYVPLFLIPFNWFYWFDDRFVLFLLFLFDFLVGIFLNLLCQTFIWKSRLPDFIFAGFLFYLLVYLLINLLGNTLHLSIRLSFSITSW